MQDSFAEIKEAIRNHSQNDSDQELNESTLNLLGFFEILLQIDREQKDKRNENRSFSDGARAQMMRQMRESLIEFSPTKLYGCNSQNFDGIESM